MTNSYYECHITMEGHENNKAHIKDIVKSLGWKFSAIDGDIVLGGGTKFYATRHYKSSIPMNRMINILLEAANKIAVNGIIVTRRKVELVLYDDRSSKVKPCDGGCIECHLEDLKTC